MRSLAIFLIFFFVGGSSFGKNVIKVYSNSFYDGGLIPKVYTCDGKDISPHIGWKSIPKGTKSFVLIVDDPDAPTARPWVHWVVYNIPGSVRELRENFPKNRIVGRILQGINDFYRIGYGGPCPPKGHGYHRYVFKLYAINTVLKLKPGATKYEVLNAMKGHILGKGKIIGRYRR